MTEKVPKVSVASESDIISVQSNNNEHISTSVHRKLEIRHVNLIAIGGSIGTSLFITIGTNGLVKAGPLGLLLAYAIWTGVILLLTVAVAEMVCYLPMPSPFLNMAGRVVDPAFECAASVNFWIMQSLYIPFEITAANGMIHFWRDDYSPAIPLCLQLVLYGVLNIFAVKIYGEAEFWLSIGKLILCVGLLFYTLITMCGGNPQGDAFGFRNWQAAGGPISEELTTGSMGRFHGFLSGLFSACLTIVGPEYLSMVAGEAKNPRHTMLTAFKTVLYRLSIFYIGGALSVTIIIAYNDPTYLALIESASGAAASPYVVAMQNLGIQVLPHIVAVLIITSIVSAGNSYTYCSSRTLYGLAKRGFAPKFLMWCYNGVPIYCVGICMCFAFLSLMQLGSSGVRVLNYMVSLCTGAQLLNYAYMATTYLYFYRACKAQGFDRSSFTYRAWWQPYSTFVVLAILVCVIGILGYRVFMPGGWLIDTFLYDYLMLFVLVVVYLSWKLVKRTKLVAPQDADLVTGLNEIEEHEYEYFLNKEESPKGVKRVFGWVV